MATQSTNKPKSKRAKTSEGVSQRSTSLMRLAGSLISSEISHRVRSVVQKTPAMESIAHRVEQATILVSELGQLKGAAMKFGQMLALEARDYLPDEAVQILEKLQNQATFLDRETIHGILSEELGDRVALLEDLSSAPIAAASIGQVHTAWVDARKVAVKIQYPDIAQSLDSDLKIFNRVARATSFLMGKREIDLGGLLDELRGVFEQETRYRTEAEFTRRFEKLTSDMKGIVVPQVFSDLSTDRILTLSFEEGHSLTTCLREGLLSPQMREHFARQILELYTSEFCRWGLVQTDPNLGNFLLRPDSGELVLLDFGASKDYALPFRKTYSRMILASLAGDDHQVLELALALELIDPREDRHARDALLDLMRESMGPFTKAKFDFSENEYSERMKFLSRDLARQLKFSPPPRSLIFLHRKLGGIFQMNRRLNVVLDLRPYLQAFERVADVASVT